MVVSDLNIICLNQDVPVCIARDGIGIDVVFMHNGYGKHWRSLRKSQGIWYQLYPIERIIQKQYGDEFFDLFIDETDYRVIVYKKYCMAIVGVINEYLELSPTHELLILIRLDEDNESLKTVEIKRDDFEHDFKTGKIKFNTIYHVTT